MAVLPPLTKDYIPSVNPVALFDAGTIRMIDPLYVDATGQNPAFTRQPPVAMLGGGNSGAGEAKSFQVLRGLNTIRMGMSDVWFSNPGTGTDFVPGAKASFQDLMAAGGKFIWLYADQSNAESVVPTGTNAEKVDSLRTVVLARCLDTFRKLRYVLENNPTFMANTLGIELFNEPAIYNVYKQAMLADPVYSAPGYFEHLFADHVIEVVREIKEWWSGQIHLPLFRYNGSATDLMAKKSGVTALDRLRRAVGSDQLVWSSHCYPGWILPGDSDAVVIGKMRKTYAPLGRDRICVSEMNVAGTSIADTPPDLKDLPSFLQAMSFCRTRGIGMGYFPAHNTGASCPMTFYADGSGELTHPWAVGEIYRLWNARGELATGVTTFPISVIADHRDIEGLVRGTVVAPALRVNILGAGGTATGAVNFYNIILGALAGGNNLAGVAEFRSYLAVYAGTNTLEARGTMDVVRGGSGSDTITAAGANALIEGGSGPSLINVNSGKVVIYPGDGVSRIVFADIGSAHEIRRLKLVDTIDLSAWVSPISVSTSEGNTMLTSGANSILCRGRTQAQVLPCIVGATIDTGGSSNAPKSDSASWADGEQWTDSTAWDA